LEPKLQYFAVAHNPNKKILYTLHFDRELNDEEISICNVLFVPPSPTPPKRTDSIGRTEYETNDTKDKELLCHTKN
jgi:hypothetical protein